MRVARPGEGGQFAGDVADLLQAAGRRRVPGLRREELATLAGISSD
jgi:hypothetical protein